MKLVDSLQIAAKLSKPVWNVKHIMPQTPLPEHARPSLEQVKKIARLSAFHIEDPSAALSDLERQLRFLRALKEVDTEGVEPLARLIAPVQVPFPEDVKEPEDPEVWDPTQRAMKTDGDFFVVDKSLTADE